MFQRDELGSLVSDIGLLIGLLTDEGGGNLSFNPEWFSDPASDLEATPKQVKQLLDLLSDLFDPIAGTQYTLIDRSETWYSVFSGWDNLPTGLCLISPQTGSTSGVIGLGIFDQFDVDDLTISMYARLPLFYLEQGQNPQFILTSSLTQYKDFEIEIDVYSSTPIQVGSDSAFNMVAVAANAQFSDSFTTDFTLSFYQGFDPDTGNKTLLPDATTEVIIGRIGQVVLQANYWLNGYIGSTPVTIGDVLSATGLVTQTVETPSGETTYSFDQTTFDDLHDPTEALKKFLISLLTKLVDELATNQTLLVPLFNGGIYATKDEATNTYGLRFAIPDYTVTPSDSSAPQFAIQLGKWLTGETDASNWVEKISGQQVDAGVDIFFLKYDGSTLSTTAYFKLASLGFDISGQGGAPLINAGGYTLKGAELRAFLDSTDWAYGFAVRLDDVGFPLGPSFDQAQQGSATTNVVAQNLLASGSQSDSQQNGSGQTTAVNPGFSAEAGYISGFSPLFEIFDLQGNQTDLIWFPIQRRFGPINCQKIGLKVDVTGSNSSAPVLGIVFDGDVSLAALDVYVDQLSINVHLKEAADVSGYDIDLQGLDVTFNGGGVDISGGLLKTTDNSGNIAYDGEALIKAEELTITALGSYGSLPGGGTSMFIFALLNYPLGGPAFFFVTGLAAGFGYNRSLKIPAQNDVQKFPLVAGLANTSVIGGDNPKPQDVLTSLEQWVPPERGEYWLAAGLQFTTFEIINTNALLIVEFGKDFIISVLGLSTLKQPQVGDAYVYAELGIEVVFLPRQGEIKASAVLAPNSYVLTPQAHLTGGFAFYAWFGSNEHAGDFVFTIGGYHPSFNVPSYYPQEPRVGINWQISSTILMVGGAYFAMTPTAMMAGGGLQVTFADGPLKAWLKAQIDIILFWKPFYMVGTASVSIGVSYRIDVLFVHKTLSVEISANFGLWGPPIGGNAHVDWYVISFTISFGSGMGQPSQLTWNEFKGLLPSKTQEQSASREAYEALFTTGPAATNTETTPAYLSINANKGLKRAGTIDGLTVWLVRAAQFQFTVASAIPASAIVVMSENSNDNYSITGNKVGLRQVNGGISSDNYQSTQTLSILQLSSDDVDHIKACMATTSPCTTQPSGCTDPPIDISDWEIDVVNKNIPQAMWGEPGSSSQTSDINSATPTVSGTVGIAMSPKPPIITNCTPEMVIDVVFADRVVNPSDEYRLPLSQTEQPSANTPQEADSFVDIAGVNDPAIVQGRNAVFRALLSMGINGWTNDPLPEMGASPGKDFADEPMEGSVAPIAFA